jgi:WD40 repeat protein
MLSGRKVFDGGEVSDVLAFVLTQEPDPTTLPAEAPPALRRLLERCLKKDRRERLHDIADARLEVGTALQELTEEVPASSPHGLPSWARPRFAIGGLITIFLLGATATLWLQSTLNPVTPGLSDAPAGPMTNTIIDLPANAPLALGSHVPLIGFDSSAVAIAPDGTRLAYVGRSETGTMLYLREMAGGEVTPLAGTEGAIHSFFSPEGDSVGFLTNNQVRKVSLRSGAVSTLTDATAPVQGWWTETDVIYFSEDQGRRLSRVPADGSERSSPMAEERLLQILGGDGQMANFSDVLPDGGAVLVTKWVNSIGGDYAEIVLLDTETLEARSLLRSGYGARYVPSGYLVFARGGNLMAVRFDMGRREVEGEEVQVAAGVGMESLFGQVHAAFSSNGLLAYAPGGDRTIGKLAWVDRNGEIEFLEDAPPQTYGVVDLTPDGRRLAVHVAGVTDYLWIYDMERRFARRMSGNESYGWPMLRPPDGREVSFASLFPLGNLIRDVDEGGAPREWLSPDLWAESWSPDGKTLALTTLDTNRIGFAPLEGETQWTDIAGWPHGFSPDGQWFAYTKDGVVWVASYPDGATRRLISDSGIETVWCPCGELFYRNGNRWFSTRIATEPDLDFDPPRLVFETDFIDTPGISYDVSPDGQRLLVVKRAEPDVQTKLHVITNWFHALEDNGR